MLFDTISAVLVASAILASARLFYVWGWNAGKVHGENLTRYDRTSRDLQKALAEIDRLRNAAKNNRTD